jgi:hypothetical protein
MLIGPVRYIFAPIRLQGPVFTALPGCRAMTLPLKREVAPTPVVARLMAATSVVSFSFIALDLHLPELVRDKGHSDRGGDMAFPV